MGCIDNTIRVGISIIQFKLVSILENGGDKKGSVYSQTIKLRK